MRLLHVYNITATNPTPLLTYTYIDSLCMYSSIQVSTDLFDIPYIVIITWLP